MGENKKTEQKPEITNVPEQEQKKGRGRPKKDPNAPPTERKFKFSAARALNALYAVPIETYNRATDNSKATSYVDFGDKGYFLMIEDGDEIAVFTKGHRCPRKPESLLALLTELGYLGD